MAHDEKKTVAFDEASYRDYARKMQLIENGPTTTNYEQLTAAGIELPEPDSIADADIGRKLWEVIAGMATLRVYLDQTDHLNDRELYTKLWREVLREEVPAIDEIGFSNCVDLVSTGSEENTALYLKYYADDREREFWLKDFPEIAMPAHEEPPFTRDWILPRPDYELGPEALGWLSANPLSSAFASNRFDTSKDAATFVEQLLAAGATAVRIDNIMWLPANGWLPYADTLLAWLPDDAAKRRDVFALIADVGRPDEDADGLPFDDGRPVVRLWWD